jgi:hypothetical protein
VFDVGTGRLNEVTGSVGRREPARASA